MTILCWYMGVERAQCGVVAYLDLLAAARLLGAEFAVDEVLDAHCHWLKRARHRPKAPSKRHQQVCRATHLPCIIKQDFQGVSHIRIP